MTLSTFDVSRITPQCYNCKYLFVDFDQIRIFHAIVLSFMQIFYTTLT